MIPYKPYVCEKNVESILGTSKNMTKKVFNLNNTIPHSVRLVNPFSALIYSGIKWTMRYLFTLAKQVSQHTLSKTIMLTFIASHHSVLFWSSNQRYPWIGWRQELSYIHGMHMKISECSGINWVAGKQHTTRPCSHTLFPFGVQQQTLSKPLECCPLHSALHSLHHQLWYYLHIKRVPCPPYLHVLPTRIQHQGLHGRSSP